MRTIAKFLFRNRGFTFMWCMAMFRSAVADWNAVPTGSMQPTIHIGDRILVDKLAYDVRLPLTHISLRHPADPQRGDIVVLDSHVADERLVQRLIGLQATKWQRAVHRRPASQLCGEPPQQHHFPRGDRLGIALD